MTARRIGLLGAGHLAGFIVEGLVRAGVPRERIALSPRGRASEIAGGHGVALAPDNRGLAEWADVLFLTVRPGQAVPALSGLPFREGQTVVSCCAGVALAALSEAARPATVVRAMPISAAAVGASPTVLFPDDGAAREVLSTLGDVIVLPAEDLMEAASVDAAVYGWVHALIGATAEWTRARGVGEAEARRLAAGTFAAAARMVAARPDQPVSEMLRALATPGGITATGLGVLAAGDFLGQWERAMDAAQGRLARNRGGTAESEAADEDG